MFTSHDITQTFLPKFVVRMKQSKAAAAAAAAAAIDQWKEDKLLQLRSQSTSAAENQSMLLKGQKMFSFSNYNGIDLLLYACTCVRRS